VVQFGCRRGNSYQRWATGAILVKQALKHQSRSQAFRLTSALFYLYPVAVDILPFLFKQWCGINKAKHGCLLEGQDFKAYPGL
jgi:hypothetical protein